jgi:glycosyltransferase involved in cell wall biosynthesis
VEAGSYDLVHVHTPIASFVTRYALRSARRRESYSVIYTAHGFHFHPGGHFLRNAVYLSLEKLAARWMDHLVVINEHDYESAIRHHLLPPARIHFIPGIGVDLDTNCPERISEAEVIQVRRELGIVDDPCVLMVAEFTRGKRHVDLLEAFERIGGDPIVRAPHLLLAGDGRLLQRVSLHARRSKYASRIHLLGQRTDIPVLMRASNVLVLPSDREGLPRCILEAMATGIPTIATRVRGSEDLLRKGGGLLYDVGDVGTLAAHLRTVLGDPALSQAMGRRAREHAEKYDLKRIIELHEQLYAEALAAEEAPARRMLAQ